MVGEEEGVLLRRVLGTSLFESEKASASTLWLCHGPPEMCAMPSGSDLWPLAGTGTPDSMAPPL